LAEAENILRYIKEGVFPFSLFAIVLALAGLLAAQTPKETVLLWPDGAPGAQGTADEDRPSLALYPASGPTKTSTGVIICPGGGYAHLAMDHEGTQIAAWLNNLGISAYILKYRLGPKYHYPVELWDAQRAIRYVRLHAAELEIRPDRIGIWGFSAGGHLASTAATHFSNTDAEADPIDRQSDRPDFAILSYPVISMLDPYAHLGSRRNLLGDKPDPALALLLSNELQVTSQTPPTFLFHTTEDQTVPVENSILFYLALRKAGVPVEMHIYQKGAHGVGLAAADPILHTWPDHLSAWLQLHGFR
jgi:acetyl esterase/lipase